jgi:YHS domain-containing protein
MKSILRALPVLALLTTSAAFAGDFYEADGAALHGYDVVSYFETGEPTKGAPQHAFTWHGSKFLFASAQHRKQFVANPEKYAPQYGGYCAYGTSNGYKVPTQPDAFKVVDGKLYLNYDRKVLGIWTQDEPGNISRADKNWPEVSKQPLRK